MYCGSLYTMNIPAESGPKSPVSEQKESELKMDAVDFKEHGLYLLFTGGKRIVLTRARIEAFARTFASNLEQLPARVRDAAAFKPCPVCPEKERAKFCHALPATLAFYEELEAFKSYDKVSAVYRGSEPGLIWVPETTMQEALQFVAILSLMYYCELGRKYRKFFLGIHPLVSMNEMNARIHLNVFWDCGGDRQKTDQVLQSFFEEITCTCRCQVQRLRLVCRSDALMGAFVNIQSQIGYAALSQGTLPEQSFVDFLEDA